VTRGQGKALVVGINQYPYLQTTSKAKKLKAQAGDAEAITQLRAICVQAVN